MAQYSKNNMSVDLYEFHNGESLTVSSTAVGLTSATYTDADGAVSQVAYVSVNDGGRVTFRLDGTNPTAQVGIILTPMSTVKLVGQDNIKNFRAIRTDSSDAVLFIQYGR